MEKERAACPIGNEWSWSTEFSIRHFIRELLKKWAYLFEYMSDNSLESRQNLNLTSAEYENVFTYKVYTQMQGFCLL